MVAALMVSAHGLHHFVNGWCNYHWQWQPSLLRVGCTCCCPINDNIPTITPFDIYVGQLSACFFSTTSLQLAALPSLPFWERLQHNIPLRAYQSCSVRNDFSSLTPRLTTPPQMEYFQVRQSLSISMWSQAHHSSKSLLIQELRLPSVPP
jgi:hypothetical protein